MSTNKTDIRWQQRLQNLEKAYSDFSDACGLKKYSKLERSGLIQTFEFTFELAWKTLQDLLLSRGYQGIQGPKPVIEQAFQDGLIHEGESWMKMLVSRNLTVHSYDEKTAEEIATLIRNKYFPLLTGLLQQLRKEKNI
ncbi:MAG: nucleotidyltransferase substrate binding protein family [Bacteriovoracaceae bacterium]|nr:nucleotidyltransferase substrate binding protein family [Bacteriovoracaceae bacterium]